MSSYVQDPNWTSDYRPIDQFGPMLYRIWVSFRQSIWRRLDISFVISGPPLGQGSRGNVVISGPPLG